ncbi:RadC family protein [Ruminiclostridium cellobioparum]|jgi:DNA repair protein RadC|uniref:DNA repair protein radc n=1 Tax=Ruminiclostridium cellobioparum subsp. termitidis CT1112 TaxID=1195236 RepID=S0FQN6_RUMCE|nr:DNA repair protein RadC [Ruminiclostridium cellobioparum]EMS74152.1 DNA repair protein radc [Ruminiclostridium cellobioparum subsp. termitidis CT1112]
MERLKIKELPIGERPYEKLEVVGAEHLSNAELLAVIIKTGTKSYTAVELAQHVLRLSHDGRLSSLNNLSIEQLKKIKGIGRVKAIQIKAALELSKRVATNDGLLHHTIKNANDVNNLMMEEMRYLKKEIFKALLLDTKNQIIKIVDVSMGSLNSSIVHPREVFSEAVKYGSNSIIFVHNHPSGDPTPSAEDLQTTQRLEKAGSILGIKVLDHIVVGDGKFVSFKEKGYI